MNRFLSWRQRVTFACVLTFSLSVPLITSGETYTPGETIGEDFSGFAKTFLAGKTPIKTTVQAQYFVTRPELVGPSWGIFFQIAPVVNVPW